MALTSEITLPVTSLQNQLAFSMPDDGIIAELSVYVSVAAAGLIENTKPPAMLGRIV